jgi:biofilm PGA synthesis lipoprotein PgaB
MRRALFLSILLLCATGARGELLALCYHEVTATTAESLRDPAAISVDMLINQFTWLDANGYVPVSLSDVIAARAGGKPLPPRAVLLTFDDGYASFYTRVLPLLKLYQFPATLAPVTSWLDTPDGQTVSYGSAEEVSREKFLSWEQLREIADSGLVEIASHSHDLHHGIQGNPQTNSQPAANTLAYDPVTGAYESLDHQRSRVRTDLATSVEILQRELGVRPHAIVWPYGAYNAIGQDIAADLGMNISFTLDDAENTPADPTRIHRILIGSDMSLSEFVLTIRDEYAPAPLRAAHIDLDHVYDPDPVQQEKNLGILLDRVKAMNLGTVILQAFADPDGNGAADSLYFPNRHLPMTADLFNRVAWQLKTRANVEVFAWLPVLAYELGDNYPGDYVAAAGSAGDGRYPRLSPFDEQNVELIEQIYADLAASNHISGLLFHDDAILGDDEDTSDAALDFYANQWLPTPDSPLIEGPPSESFARLKTRHLIELTHRFADAARRHRPAIKTARNLYAPVVLTPESESWFAQNFALSLEAYDYTALMAMPYLEGAATPERWLKRLVETVASYPNGLDRTLFELQTFDWRSGRRLSDAELAAHFDLLLYNGVRHIAYYPDDFLNDAPSLETLRSRLSINAYAALQE